MIDSWPDVAIHDVCNPKQWPTIPQTAFVEEGYPVYGANGKIGFYTEFNHETPTVLITCRGATCGTINVCEPKSYVTGNSMALDNLDESRVFRQFLVYALRHRGLAKAISGTAQPQITREGLTGVKIPLPPLSEQRRIAEVLDRAEALRAKRRAALAQLDSLTQSLFLDLFGDPATNPKGWPIKRIGDLLESASYGTSEKSATTGQFPVLRMNNITRTGAMDFADLKFMDLDVRLHERYLVRSGDVLFNRTNSPDLVGKTAIFREAEPMAYAGYLIRLRVAPDNDPEYLSAFLNTGYAKRMLRGMCKSIIGMANINATEIQAMRLPHPPIALQRDFARRVAAVERLRAAQRASLSELDALFACLQHRAFRGEL